MISIHPMDAWNPADTARLTAAFRSEELRQTDPLVRDHLASKLAGDRGFKLRERFPGSQSATGSIVRTMMIDDIILDLLSSNSVDAVVCPGAGFDTRPYRLSLAKSLKWIEFDLPDVLQRKNTLLKGVQPNCEVRRYPVDLTQTRSRRKLFRQHLAEFKNIVVITEGLLIYLTQPEVAALAADLRLTEKVFAWVTDLGSPTIRDWMNQFADRDPSMSGIRWSFAPANSHSTFQSMGWKMQQLQSVTKRAESVNRPLISQETRLAIGQLGVDPDQLSTIAILQPGKAKTVSTD